jgi:hypothetical protein
MFHDWKVERLAVGAPNRRIVTAAPISLIVQEEQCKSYGAVRHFAGALPSAVTIHNPSFFQH